MPPPASTSTSTSPVLLRSPSDNDTRAGARSSSFRSAPLSTRSTKSLPRNTSNMSSFAMATPLQTSPRPATTGTTTTTTGRLHRRHGATATDQPAAVSPPTAFPSYGEPFPELCTSPPPVSTTTKFKPSLRKTSGAREDQGKLDLSKSTADSLAGLGIQDHGYRAATDVAFTRAERRQPSHARTTSSASHTSGGSISFKPSTTFVHPMRQTPRPYTPPLAYSSNSSLNDEADEQDDTVEDQFKPGHGFRSRRSTSIHSTQQFNPTRLSQSQTIDDLVEIPKLTSASMSNLSIKSSKSNRSLRSKLGHSRRNTNASSDQLHSPSSRTSFDKAFGFGSRRSDVESLSRDERIREARRKFEEKEADKDRKLEEQTRKRREAEETKVARREERQRRKSGASEHGRPARAGNVPRSRKDSALDEKALDSRNYGDLRPAPQASLPIIGKEAGYSEKPTMPRFEHGPRSSKSGWLRFSTWMHTRMLSCG